MKKIYLPIALGLFLSIILIVTACRKKTDPPAVPESCRGYSEIVTQGYNKDSVIIHFPTVFTPNGDGLNDRFAGFGLGYTWIEFQIQNGNDLVYETTDPDPYWDGTFNGTAVNGLYSFYAKLLTSHNETIEVQGKVEVVGPNSTLKVQNCNQCVFPDQFDDEHGAVAPTQDEAAFCK